MILQVSYEQPPKIMGPRSPVGRRATWAKLTEMMDEVKILGNPGSKFPNRLGFNAEIIQPMIVMKITVMERKIFIQQFSLCSSSGGGTETQRETPKYAQMPIMRME